ncbi:MMPL family transporter [Streptomyces sp. NPDC020096]
MLLSPGIAGQLCARGIGGRLSPETLTPASAESPRADSVLASRFGAGDPHLVLLAEAPGSVDEALAAKTGRALTDRLAADPRTAWVRGYWPYRLQEFRSSDRHHALVLVRFRGDERAVRSAGDDAIARYTRRIGPLRVAAAGETAVLSETERLSKRGLLRAEIVTAPLVLVILLWTFRSAVVALIPTVVGILAVVATTALLRLLTDVTSVSVFARLPRTEPPHHAVDEPAQVGDGTAFAQRQ